MKTSASYPVYRGIPRQYGHGLGSIFKTAIRTIVPILKPVAKAGLRSAKKVVKEQGISARYGVRTKCKTSVAPSRSSSFEATVAYKIETLISQISFFR